MAAQQDDKQKKEMVKQLLDRVKRDPAFVDQVRSDPVGTLRQQGFPDIAIGEILRDDGYANRDPNDPNLKPKQKDAISIARTADCWLTCPCTKCCITSF